ncbi:YqgE/AlgH family protein, partial [Kitasatospora sp. NPDC047058]
MTAAHSHGSRSHTGRLLVATPVLTDPNFARAVVLLLDHDAEGALGVVLNRPTPVEVGSVL